MAERTIHIEGDSIKRATEELIRAKEIELAETPQGEPGFDDGMHIAMDNETAPDIAEFQPRLVRGSDGR